MFLPAMCAARPPAASASGRRCGRAVARSPNQSTLGPGGEDLASKRGHRVAAVGDLGRGIHGRPRAPKLGRGLGERPTVVVEKADFTTFSPDAVDTAGKRCTLAGAGGRRRRVRPACAGQRVTMRSLTVRSVAALARLHHVRRARYRAAKCLLLDPGGSNEPKHLRIAGMARPVGAGHAGRSLCQLQNRARSRCAPQDPAQIWRKR